MRRDLIKAEKGPLWIHARRIWHSTLAGTAARRVESYFGDAAAAARGRDDELLGVMTSHTHRQSVQLSDSSSPCSSFLPSLPSSHLTRSPAHLGPSLDHPPNILTMRTTLFMVAGATAFALVSAMPAPQVSLNLSRSQAWLTQYFYACPPTPTVSGSRAARC